MCSSVPCKKKKAANANLEDIMLNEISQAYKEKHIVFSCLWNLKKVDLMDVENRIVVIRDGKVWKSDSTEGYLFLTTISVHLKNG